MWATTAPSLSRETDMGIRLDGNDLIPCGGHHPAQQPRTRAQIHDPQRPGAQRGECPAQRGRRVGRPGLVVVCGGGAEGQAMGVKGHGRARSVHSERGRP
jgi:hypothetical protein